MYNIKYRYEECRSSKRFVPQSGEDAEMSSNDYKVRCVEAG